MRSDSYLTSSCWNAITNGKMPMTVMNQSGNPSRRELMMTDINPSDKATINIRIEIAIVSPITG
jgi:hypothetical protein